MNEHQPDDKTRREFFKAFTEGALIGGTSVVGSELAAAKIKSYIHSEHIRNITGEIYNFMEQEIKLTSVQIDNIYNLVAGGASTTIEKNGHSIKFTFIAKDKIDIEIDGHPLGHPIPKNSSKPSNA
jgi:hypothetical protein